MKRITLMGTAIVMTLILGLVGCQMFDDSPTEVGSLNADATVVSDFIMGDPELDTWGAYYNAGETFVRVDIPVAGALKVAYSTTGGFSGAIFAQTGAAVGLEIGVREDDVIDSVCVSYVEGGSFTALPANVEAAENRGRTHYLRLTDDGSTSPWWPANAAFVFSGDATTACGVVNSEVQWDLISGGAFDKPSTEPSIEPNAAPVASNVTFAEEEPAELILGNVRLKRFVYEGSYDYSDAEGDEEGTSLYQWYSVVNDGDVAPIEGATSTTYTLGGMGCIAFCVRPVALTGTMQGEWYCSGFDGNNCSSEQN